ncbi:MAG: DUF1800 family protein, partial [Bacteroidota bacterium]
MASILPKSGTLGLRLATHLLRRTTFGFTKAQADLFAGLSVTQALDQLFTSPTLPPHPIDPTTGLTWVISGRTGANSPDEDLNGVTNSWFLDFALADQTTPSLYQRLVFFLHTLFPTGHNDIEFSENFYYTIRLFMVMAQGNCSIKELALKVCLDNGMNNYLDIGDSEAGNPNEN